MRLVKIPFNGGALDKKTGQELAPEKIAGFLKYFFMNESGMLPVINQETVDVDNSNLEESFHKIEEQLSNLDGFTVIVGGDHSITYPCFKAFAKKYSNPGIVVFDAHPDMQDDFKISHEDYLRVLLNEKVVKKENIILVGVRNWSKEEVMFLKSNKIKHYTVKEMSFEIRREICDAIMSVARGWDAFYLSIDIDVLDPAFSPGTGHLEPGGMTTRDLLYFVQRLKLLKNLKAVDITEVNPKKDVNDITSKIAAKIIVELA
ncbi:MAG: arginase family protein [Nanoarchaeota archaeon]|nr:arginase family protein [DPANN group archaeon]MBL7116464.1 arginase family protein [Nanoarchaeota archaeon]